MIRYVTGDLFDSDAYALVNAVNCEGVMGKGIAYQFKQRYPYNFKVYREACESGILRPGGLLTCEEGDKLIINFPTKDKWRNPSEMYYIREGLGKLSDLIINRRISSIAIPPLGAGNGGLVWKDVRRLMEERLYYASENCLISVYEPSTQSGKNEVSEPWVSVSGLVLLEIMARLQKPVSEERVRRACRYMNFASNNGDFNRAYNGVQSFKRFHRLKSNAVARDILYRRIVSDSVERTLRKLSPAISEAVRRVNSEKE